MECKRKFINSVTCFVAACFLMLRLQVMPSDIGYGAPGYDLCPEKIENMRALLAWQDRHNEQVLRMAYTADYADEVRLNAEKHEIDSLIAADREFVYQCLQQAALKGQRISLTGGSPPRTAHSIVQDALNIKTKTKFNYSLGHSTRQECEKAAEDFLGSGWHWSRDKRVRISADGMRQYRGYRAKPERGGVVQANFLITPKRGEEPPWFIKKEGQTSFFNGHLYILNP